MLLICRTISACLTLPRCSRKRSSSGAESKWSSIAFLPLPVTMMMFSMPEATHSSTTYWISGLSTTGSISLCCALVAGRDRVPSPAAGRTALRTRLTLAAISPHLEFHLAPYFRSASVPAGVFYHSAPVAPGFSPAYLRPVEHGKRHDIRPRHRCQLASSFSLGEIRIFLRYPRTCFGVIHPPSVRIRIGQKQRTPEK